MRHGARVLAALAALALVAACNTSDVGTSRSGLLSEADLTGLISMAEALAIAQAEVPGGVAIEAELEIEDDDEVEPPAYEVSFFVPGDNRVIEVEVHAETGAVLEVEVEDGGDDDGEHELEQEGEHEG